MNTICISFEKVTFCNRWLIIYFLCAAGKMDADLMDEKRKEHVAYEYLCHLEEAKKYEFLCWSDVLNGWVGG